MTALGGPGGFALSGLHGALVGLIIGVIKKAPGLNRGLYNSLCLLTRYQPEISCRPFEPADVLKIQAGCGTGVESGRAQVNRS